MDMPPYPSRALRTRSQTRRGHDGYGPISIARAPYPFTDSPRSRWIWPHIHRACSVPVHGLAEVAMDMAPYPSCVLRTRARTRRGRDGYAPISIVCALYPFTDSPRSRRICPHIHRDCSAPVHGRVVVTMISRDINGTPALHRREHKPAEHASFVCATAAARWPILPKEWRRGTPPGQPAGRQRSGCVAPANERGAVFETAGTLASRRLAWRRPAPPLWCGRLERAFSRVRAAWGR
jgi:hypothetical protein